MDGSEAEASEGTSPIMRSLRLMRAKSSQNYKKMLRNTYHTAKFIKKYAFS